MTLYEYINTNFDRIRYETKIGLIPISILSHWEIYSRFDAFRKRGLPVSDAVMFTEMEMKVSDSTVYKVKKQMESTI